LLELVLVAGSSGRFNSIAAAAGHGSDPFAAGLADCKEHRLKPADEKEIRDRVAAGEGPRRRRASTKQLVATESARLPFCLAATEAEKERLARHGKYLKWLKKNPG